jgi:type 1 glutamine amidotransferase
VAHISKHRNGWKKYIGGRRFYSHLGHTEDDFKLVVAALVARWEAIVARGWR